MRKSLQNSGEKIESLSLNNAEENLDHMEVSQLLNYVNQGSLATTQPSTSFSTLLKFDMDESEAVDSSLNTTTEVLFTKFLIFFSQF